MQKGVNIKYSSVSTESGPETRLERLLGYMSCEQQIFIVVHVSSFQEHKDDQNHWPYCQLFFLTDNLGIFNTEKLSWSKELIV